jgi:flavin reductase (DIM6/NTAB) family NADH-FMN oxidoreductase RutF
MSQINPDSITKDAFRKTMGRFASGVTVISTRIDGKVHGMTASAFFSLSLEPPLIAVSIDNSARIKPLIEHGKLFGVSFLSREQEACSNHFAGMHQDGLSVEFREYDGFSLIEGALAHLGCNLESALPGGDHTIMIGRIVHLEYFEGREPLLYYSGGHHGLADIS